ncbi:uncharacterized protein LOC143909453 [Arctopsyche grandis]|uniref:uncharacterized protein LOC143909453 n=1 Tax=Arctopsyche grandis TaxID=121162 RepID=UPI00406D6D9D
MENNQNKIREWTNEETYLLIDLYKEKPSLWDPTHYEYKLRSKRYKCWMEMSKIFNCNVTDLRKKMESLLTSFRRERQRCEATKKLGDSTDDIVYKSKWFGFEKMKFLIYKFTPRVFLDTMDMADDSLKVSVGDSTDKRNLNNPTMNRRKVFKSLKKLNLVRNATLNRRAEETYNIMQALKRRNERDSSSTFGEHIANKHRTYSSRTKTMVEHFISKLIFEADMGRYESNYSFDAASIHPPISYDSLQS